MLSGDLALGVTSKACMKLLGTPIVGSTTRNASKIILPMNPTSEKMKATISITGSIPHPQKMSRYKIATNQVFIYGSRMCILSPSLPLTIDVAWFGTYVRFENIVCPVPFPNALQFQ